MSKTLHGVILIYPDIHFITREQQMRIGYGIDAFEKNRIVPTGVETFQLRTQQGYLTI